MTPLSSVRDHLLTLQAILFHLGRYQWIYLLLNGAYVDKLKYASYAGRLFDAAWLLQDFRLRQFQDVSRPIFWDSKIKPNFESLDQADVDIVSSALLSQFTIEFEALNNHVRELPILSPCLSILDQIQFVANSKEHFTSTSKVKPIGARARRLHGVRKTLTGPKNTMLDPSFEPAYSVLDLKVPVFTDTLRDTVPYFWTLSTREAMACDCCALSGVEYDGLPLDFYRDMGKQAWDEIRHAVMYFDLAKQLMPTLVSRLATSDPLFDLIRQFLAHKVRLPVPSAGNLYEAIWSADLTERLILMQIDTEGKAPKSLRKQMSAKLCVEFPTIKWMFEIDSRDEIAHARIGHYWLKHLIPLKERRSEVVEQSRLLRGIFLLSSISNAENTEFVGLLDSFASGRSLPSN